MNFLKVKLGFFSWLLLCGSAVFAQNTGISDVTNTPNASAVLDVYSTTKGMLVPRMTSTQRTGITNPALGLLVYQTDGPASGFYYYTGTAWLPIASGSGSRWSLDPNNSNNIYYTTGFVGVGVASPTRQLVVNKNLEIRRGSTTTDIAELLFSNTVGGNFRAGSDEGHYFWQGGNGKSLQMGSSYNTVITGDRQPTTPNFPAVINHVSNRSVIIKSSRAASVPLSVQGVTNQTANLMEWLDPSGTVLNVVNNGGNLGLGVTSPVQKLDVAGNIKFSGNLLPNGTAGTSGQILQISGPNNLPVWTDPGPATSSSNWALGGNTFTATPGIRNFGTVSAHDLPFITSDTERMRILAGGNVGIGLANPAEKLDVAGNIRFSGALLPNGTAGTAGQILQSAGTTGSPVWADPGSFNWSLGGNNVTEIRTLGTTSNFELPFITNNVERMRILAGGNVGIGLVDPSEKLDVAGNIKFSGNLLPNGTAGTAGQILQITGPNNLPVWTNVGSATSSTNWALGGNTLPASPGNRNFGTINNFGLPFITNNIERMRITTAGNVGIGVTDPGRQLVVNNNIEIRRGATDIAELLFSNTGGNPGGEFRIGSDGGDIFWQGGGSRSLQMGSFWATIISGDRQATGFPASIPSTNTSISNRSVIIKSSRTVSVPLSVQGIANQTANLMEWLDPSGTVLNVVNNGGNLGLGVPSPSQKLDVAGNIKINGALMPTSTTFPNGTAGTAGQVLLSAGANASPVWTDLGPATSSTNWALGGNNLPTSPGTRNFGTTNNFPLPIITNGTERMRISETGRIGIGTNAPTSTLSISGSLALAVKTQATDYTLTEADRVVIKTGTANITFTLPASNTCTGRIYRVVNHGTGSITILPAIVTGTNTSGANITEGSLAAGAAYEIISDGTNWRKLINTNILKIKMMIAKDIFKLWPLTRKSLLLFVSFLMPFMLQAQGVLNNGGRIVLGTNANITISGNLTNVATGTNGSINNNGTITLSGNFINNGSSVVVGTNGSVAVAGSLTNAAANTGNGSINNDGLIVVGGNLTNNGSNIVVGDNASLLTGGDIINATTNTSKGTIDNNGIIVLKGNFTNNADNNVFINLNGIGDVVFVGESGQVITSASTNPIIFEGLTVDNTSVGVSLQKSVVTNRLALNKGPLYLNGWSLTIDNNNPAAVTRTNGYLVSEQTNNSGKVTWKMGKTTGAHVFPFGNGSGNYIPFTFDLTAGDVGNVTVSTYATDAANLPYPTTPDAVTNVNGWNGKDNSINTVDRFWQIDKDGTGGTATLTFTASPAEIGEVTLLQAQRWNAAQAVWEFPLPGQTNTATSATVPGVTNFSPWTLSGNNSPLPVEISQFTATVNKSWVDLRWKTAAETPDVIYTIERTRDLQQYETVATIKSNGLSQEVNTYFAQDINPFSGLSYYRLKQTNAGKQSAYSEVVAVDFKAKTAFGVSVYPNPIVDILNIAITGTPGQEYSVVLTDLIGQRYYAGKVFTEKSEHLLQLHKKQHFPAGVYMLSVSGNGHYYSKKIVVE